MLYNNDHNTKSRYRYINVTEVLVKGTDGQTRSVEWSPSNYVSAVRSPQFRLLVTDCLMGRRKVYFAKVSISYGTVRFPPAITEIRLMGLLGGAMVLYELVSKQRKVIIIIINDIENL